MQTITQDPKTFDRCSVCMDMDYLTESGDEFLCGACVKQDNADSHFFAYDGEGTRRCIDCEVAAWNATKYRCFAARY